MRMVNVTGLMQTFVSFSFFKKKSFISYTFLSLPGPTGDKNQSLASIKLN